ncbi:hypothetical protein H8D57_00730 [bacterium]|nr:hypothetical protein [bacterium]
MEDIFYLDYFALSPELITPEIYSELKKNASRRNCLAISSIKSERKDDKSVLDEWVIPLAVTIGSGVVIYSIYSIRGR